MDIVIDIVCLCVWFWLYVSQCLRSVLYFKVHLPQKLYCMPFLYCHTMSHIMPGSVSFIWQCICWDVNVHLSLNVNGTHIFCWWMHWTLSVTLSVCVFDFASMLVNIYVVYCILKYICHRSYTAYHFYFFILCLILCLDQWILFGNIVAGMSMSICHWMLMALKLFVDGCNGHCHWHCLCVCFCLYISQYLFSVRYFKVHLPHKLYCIPFYFYHSMLHIIPGSVSFYLAIYLLGCQWVSVTEF